jgi:hypothetical protein
VPIVSSVVERRLSPLSASMVDVVVFFRPRGIRPSINQGVHRLTDPSVSPEQLAQLSADVAQYITDQRERYRSSAVPLSRQQMTAMAGHFSPELLAEVRVMPMKREQLETPTFFLMGLGLIDPTAFTMMAAMTFSDVIVSNVPLTDSILFHELVHCEQYLRLGVRGFAESYAKGYLRVGSVDSWLIECAGYPAPQGLATRWKCSRNQSREIRT